MFRTTAPSTGRVTVRAIVVAVTVLTTLGLAGPASAAAPQPFTMTDHVDNSGIFTFATTGPLCSSGTFVDDVQVAAIAQSAHARSDIAVVLIRSTYTCADSSGTFQELKHLNLSFNDTGFNDSGPVEILGGTGAYAGTTGHGFTSGATNVVAGVGGGATSGVVKLP